MSATTDITPARPTDSTDTPIPVWPEGVVAVIAGIALLVIGLRHRTWLQRRGGEVQRAVAEFQRQGGLDELTQVAQHAAELVRGGKK
jgi:hypothetical protein